MRIIKASFRHGRWMAEERKDFSVVHQKFMEELKVAKMELSPDPERGCEGRKGTRIKRQMRRRRERLRKRERERGRE